jgi:hypothetical protein
MEELVFGIPIILLLIFFWFREFIFMMSLNDSNFPGKSDKVLWFIIFFILPLFAPFLFRAWKKIINNNY